MFLSANDVQALTGYKKPALQRRWLIQHGYRFDVRADGRPAVLAAQVEQRHGVKAVTSNVGPNWSALE